VHNGIKWENLGERDHLQNVAVDGWIILQWIFKKFDGWACIGLIWLRIGAGAGLL